MASDLIKDNNKDNFIIKNNRLILLSLIICSGIIFAILFFDSNKKTVDGEYSEFMNNIIKI